MVQFFVPGKPIGKQRPKFNKKTKNTYTPKETRDYEALVKQCYMQKYRDKEPIPAKTPVEVEIYARFKIPKNMPKKQKELIENNELFPTVKPDSDNISKKKPSGKPKSNSDKHKNIISGLLRFVKEGLWKII